MFECLLQNTGEIRTARVLDREVRAEYSLSAIPLTGAGENIKVVIQVEDVNDNAPTFPSSLVEIGLPENTPRDSKRHRSDFPVSPQLSARHTRLAAL